MNYERVGDGRMAAVKAAAEAWESLRTGRAQAPFSESQKVKDRFHCAARSDVVLSLIDEVEHHRRLATGASDGKSLPSPEKSTPEGFMAATKKEDTKRRTGTKGTKRKTAPKTARAKTPRKRAAKKTVRS